MKNNLIKKTIYPDKYYSNTFLNKLQNKKIFEKSEKSFYNIVICKIVRNFDCYYSVFVIVFVPCRIT